MMNSNTFHDDMQIRRLRQRWAFSRDQGDFEEMSKCFHPDAVASISWFNGPVTALTELLRKGDAARAKEEHSKHWLGNCLTQIEGSRALVETDVQILMREYIDGQLFDYIGYSRFFDQVELRKGEWRITRWTAIFDKDRLDAVQGNVPEWLNELQVKGDSSGFAFMQLRQLKKGRQLPPDPVIGGSTAETSLRRQAFFWLHEHGA